MTLMTKYQAYEFSVLPGTNCFLLCRATGNGDGAIPDNPDSMPDTIEYDEAKRRLLVGTGFIDNVSPAVWQYEVSGKRVLTQWFSYRKKNRERPIIGDRWPPSKLGDIQPDHGWPSTRLNS